MIDAKQAIAVAKEMAANYYAGLTPELEEIERGDFQGKVSWSITLSFPEADTASNTLVTMATGRRNRRYKRFVIAADTGEFLAMQIRSVAA